MSKDPEVESYAGSAALRACREYDEEKGVPLKRWVAYCVKIDVWCYWRTLKRRREEQLTDCKWETVSIEWGPEETNELTSEEWQILCESYIERWCLDVIARRHNISSVYKLKKLMRAAEAKLTKYSL